MFAETFSSMAKSTDESVREARDKIAYAAGIASIFCDRPISFLVGVKDRLQDLIDRRMLPPVSKESAHVMQCHLIDLRGSVPAAGHEPWVDEGEVDSGGSIAGTLPA